VIKRGVEIAGQHHRRVTGRGQRGQLAAPARGRRQVPRRHRRMRVHADQVHGLPGRQVEARGGLGGVAGPDGQPLAQRVAGVDAAAAVAVLFDVEHLVGQHLAEASQLQPDDRVAGEFLEEQHVSTGPAGEPDQPLPRGPAVLQVDRQHAQHGPGRGGRPTGDRAGHHDRGERCRGQPRGRGRPSAAQRDRSQPGPGGRLRGEGQQRHGRPLQRAEAIGGREAGHGPAGDAACDGPLQAGRGHCLIVARAQALWVRRPAKT